MVDGRWSVVGGRRSVIITIFIIIILYYCCCCYYLLLLVIIKYNYHNIDLGNEKRYIFHCTNPKLVEIRKAFTPEIYETFTPYPDDNSTNDILHIILRGSPYVNYNRIGTFL